MLISIPSYAHAAGRLLVIPRPAGDGVLVRLIQGVNRDTGGMLVTTPETPGAPRPSGPTDEAAAGLSKGKEAYEFLRFDESIQNLNDAVSVLKGRLDSDEALHVLREAYLYLTMDYLALDRQAMARRSADGYACISNGERLDPELWPPNLTGLVHDRSIALKDSLMPVTIRTSPPDADVTIDGRDAGRSPLGTGLPQCEHYIKVSKTSYLTKYASMDVGPHNDSIDIGLAPDPLSLSETGVQDEQIRHIMDTYKVEGILLLSAAASYSAPGNGTSIKVTLIRARASAAPSSTSSIVIAYRDDAQAAGELMRFLQPASVTPAHEENILKPGPVLSNKAPVEEKTEGASQAWYMNKWLWAAAGVGLVTGGIVYAATQGTGGHASASTGSVSIKW